MRILWAVLIILLLVPTWAGLSRKDSLGPVARVTVAPVTIRTDGGRTVGALMFVRGYRLRSPDPVFGGFSSLLVDGDRFTLLSDGGDIVRFHLSAGGQLSAAQFGALPAGPGTGWLKEDRDSESMTRDSATGAVWVGFEGYNQIWRYTPGLTRAEARIWPCAMRGWPDNGGPETMVRLRDGRFIVISEQQEGARGVGRVGLVFARDPTRAPAHPLRFTYLPPAGYEPTDAAELPDGRVVLLNRRFQLLSGFTAVMTIIDPAAIRAGGLLKAQEVARFSGDVLHDNYEGIAVVRDGADTMLWIVSDDNQSMFQQTLLLQFRLNPAPAVTGGR
jgi:hypothetical protein